MSLRRPSKVQPESFNFNASSLEAARAGADIIDVGMQPLSWGTGHADLLTIHAMLKDAGFEVEDINMNAYMEVRRLTQEFMNDFLGYYINPLNRQMNSLLIGSGLPGGMMGSLMADLEKNIRSLNKWMAKNGKPDVSQDDLLIKLFNEVEYVWPQMGYPPLVTPFSQYVKNVALMNVTQIEKGKQRWSMIDENTWGMLMGRSGQLLGPLGEDLQALALNQKREPYTGNPQDLYPDELELFAAEMEKNGWDYGEDDEELFELAMHPAQYKDYKSGKAKEKFNADLEERKAKKTQSTSSSITPAAIGPINQVHSTLQPKNITVDVDGEKFKVNISYDDAPIDNKNNSSTRSSSQSTTTQKAELGSYQTIEAPLEGKFYLTKESSDRPAKIGDIIHEGDTVAFIESMKVINAIAADKSGKIIEITAKHGEDIEEDDVMFKII